MSRRHLTAPAGDTAGAASPTPPAAPRVYLSAEQLEALTPWSVDAIDKMVQRGILKKGVHFFQLGQRTERLYKWPAIVALVEGTSDSATADAMIHGAPAA